MSNESPDLESAESVRQRLREVIRIEAFHPPADPAAVAAAEARLSAAFPAWLRTLYLACDGFVEPTGWDGYLLPLGGSNGLVGYTECLRHDTECMPPSMARAIVFGCQGYSFTISTHFASLDGVLVTWNFGNDDFAPFDGTVYDLYRREQAELDSFAAERDARPET
jgi:hypothetical protein